MIAARNIISNKSNVWERIANPISCMTPIAIIVTNTTVNASILTFHASTRFAPIKFRNKSANDSEPIIMADNLKIKPLNSTPSPNVGSVEVKTHTDIGAIKLVGIDKPVTIAGSILTSNANAAAELSGGAAEAKVKPVVIQFEKPIVRQIKNVVLGKIISTKNIVVMTSSGLLNTENNFKGSILNIEIIAIRTEISTT